MSDIDISFPWWIVPVAIFYLPVIVFTVPTGLNERWRYHCMIRRRQGRKEPRWFDWLQAIVAAGVWIGLGYAITR